MEKTNQSNIKVQVEKKKVLLVTEYRLVTTTEINIDNNQEGFNKGYEMAEALETQINEIILIMADGTVARQQLQEIEVNEENLSLIDEDENVVYAHEAHEEDDE